MGLGVSRGNVLTVEVITTALALAGCASDQRNSVHDTQPPTPATAPAETHGQPQTTATFSKTLRAGLRESHDESAENNFSAAVLNGSVTREQYDAALKQNLAVFECMHDVINTDEQLPQDLRAQFLKDLSEVINAFRADLNMQPGQRLSDQDILTSTHGVLEMLRAQSSQGIAVCAYLDLGGNAFGTHDLAQALQAKGFNNVAGFTVYTFDKFRGLIGLMNETFTDASQYPAMTETGKAFFQAHERIYESETFISNP